MSKLKTIFSSLGEAISDDVLWWFTSFILAVFQPVLMYNNARALSVLGLTENFLLYLVPTILGCLVAVYRSPKKMKEKWGMIVSSLLFNGYILESIYEFYGYEPNSLGYFLGGLSAYYLLGFLFAILDQLKEKGLPMIWETVKRVLGEVNLKMFAPKPEPPKVVKKVSKPKKVANNVKSE